MIAPISYQAKVFETFGKEIQPDKGESWNALHTRLDKKIFNPELSSQDKLYEASMLGCERAIKKILNEDPDLDINARKTKYYPTPLINAAAGGHVAATRVLLKRGADINLKIVDSTPLFFACQSQSLKVMEFFLERGMKVDFNVANEIIEQRYDDGLTLLHSFDQTIDIPSKYQKTPLFKLVQQEKIDLERLKWALKAGCSPNYRDASGATVLHHVLGRKAGGALNCLLDHGAISYIDNNGYTPMDWLLFDGNPVIQKERREAELKATYKILKMKIGLRLLSTSLKLTLLSLKIENWIGRQDWPAIGCC